MNARKAVDIIWTIIWIILMFVGVFLGFKSIQELRGETQGQNPLELQLPDFPSFFSGDFRWNYDGKIILEITEEEKLMMSAQDLHGLATLLTLCHLVNNFCTEEELKDLIDKLLPQYKNTQ